MSNIKNIVKSFLKKYNIDKTETPYLVAFSGGYDSMCLLHTLKSLKPQNKIIAIHLNHKWRGAESDKEEINCKNFCEQIGVEFYSQSLGKSIAHTETAARDARYKFFEQCGKKFNSDIIFTAHNKNDNAETVLYRICKGTGVSGLQGISEKRESFYRPLLTVARKNIEQYCKKNNLIPNNDSSNFDTKYNRNFIRLSVIPQLEKINPAVTDMINSLSELASEETKIVEEYLKILSEKITKNGQIQTKKFANLSGYVQKRLIYELFLANNLDYDRKKIEDVLDFILQNSNSKSGKTRSLTENLWIFVSDKKIQVITKTENKEINLHITKEGEYKIGQGIFLIEKFTKPVKKYPKDSENTAYVDLSKLDFNFDLRTRKDGDTIKPYGMDGSQKLKKYLNSKKIPNHEKENLLFFTQENEVLWAINLGISDKIKVVKNPTHKLKWTILE